MSLTPSRVVSGQEPKHGDELNNGHRLPIRPIICVIDENGVAFQMDSEPEIISYDIKESYYKSLEVDNDDLIWVYEFKQREGLAFKVRLNKVSDEGYVLKRFDTVEEYVCHNQICLANTIGIFNSCERRLQCL